MSIASEISRLQTAKANLKTSIENKGVTVPSNATLDSYSSYVDGISQGLSSISVKDYGFKFQYSTFSSLPSFLDFSECTDFQNMFSACSNLSDLSNLNTSSATNMTLCFLNCTSLITCPSLDTSNVTSVVGMFDLCSNLTTVNELDFSKVTMCDSSLYKFLGGCNNLLNLGGFKDYGKAFLTSVAANYTSYTLDLAGTSDYLPPSNQNISHDSLMNVINKLYDIATKGCNTQKLILASSNLARLSASEIAIATNKGWTVS